MYFSFNEMQSTVSNYYHYRLFMLLNNQEIRFFLVSDITRSMVPLMFTIYFPGSWNLTVKGLLID
jgi:hypothetical protein